MASQRGWASLRCEGMASARNVIPAEAHRRALLHLERNGTAVFDAWRADPDVAELRWLAGGLTSTLRTSLEVSLRDVMSTADPAAGLASVSVLQALVLAVIDGG